MTVAGHCTHQLCWSNTVDQHHASSNHASSTSTKNTHTHSAQTCTLRDGWDLFGNDINNGCAADQRVASAELCCERCQATNGCRAFSFTKTTDARCAGMWGM